MNESEALTFHLHWLNYWKSLAMACLLAVLTPIGLLAWLPLGIGCLVLATVLAAGVYLDWTWNTFGFTDDGRLIRRRGVFGCTRDIITLFGVLTPYQIPGLGEALDVGSVQLGVVGPDIHIQHIANFRAFYERLIYSTQQQRQGRDSPLIQFVFQVPPAP